jgi:hypothetical protein
MQKTIFLVPTKYAQEMLPNADTDQKLASGSYMIGVKPKKLTANAIAQRAFKRQRGEAGYKRLDVLLEDKIYNALLAKRQEGETFAQLVARLLLNLPDNLDQISIGEADN